MSLAERTFWLDGRLVPAAEATVSVLAQSMQRGTLVFDVFAVVDTAGGPRGLGAREHAQRFLESAALVDLPLSLTVDDLLEAARAVVRASPGADSVRFNAYWPGPSADLVPVDDRPSVLVAAFAWTDLHPGSGHGGGAARLTVPGIRKVPAEVLPVQAKVAGSYTRASVEKSRAQAAGFHDAILLDDEGNLAETGTLSLFFVAGGVVRTAGLDRVLDGITRRVLLDIAAHEGVPVEIGPLPRSLVDEADEAFLTSTSRGVLPVELIDDRPLTAPGPVSARLGARFEAILRNDDPLAARWLQPL